MFITTLLQRFFISLAMLTSMGTLVQDLRVNKALELALPANASINMTSNLESLNDAVSHSHIEKPTFNDAVAGTPRIQPREDHRRYVINKTNSRSTDNFGGSSLLWPNE